MPFTLTSIIPGSSLALGPFRPTAGTVSDPAFSTSEDTNTGIYFPTADTIAFTEGGVERMRINSSGNVGIGTSSPSTTLQVVTSGATQAGISATNTTGNANMFLSTANTGTGTFFFGDTDNYAAGFIQYAHTSDSFITRSAGTLIWQTGGANERMRIDSNGHLVPGANNTYDLGTSSLRWRNIYTNDLNLSNGIGDYTIVEGEEDLFLYNNKNGKTYKFLIQEVDPSIAPPKGEK